MSEDAGTSKDRQFYLGQAYMNAFGNDDEAAWDPDQGFAANRARLIQAYDYYQATYLKQPDLFLWAGLGRMAGGVVVAGLDTVMTLPLSSESFLTKTLVSIAKTIFHDIAWLHEAFLDDTQTAIILAGEHDTEAPARRSYATAWMDITSGDSDRVAAGNQALLENEQFTIIQPLYDAICASDEAGTFSRTRAFTNSIHPYHRDFLVRFPSSDVTVAEERWAWITEEDGMWAKWLIMPSVAPQERTRLVSLTFDDLLQRRFAPVVQALLPIGADDED